MLNRYIYESLLTFFPFTLITEGDRGRTCLELLPIFDGEGSERCCDIFSILGDGESERFCEKVSTLEGEEESEKRCEMISIFEGDEGNKKC